MGGLQATVATASDNQFNKLERGFSQMFDMHDKSIEQNLNRHEIPIRERQMRVEKLANGFAGNQIQVVRLQKALDLAEKAIPPRPIGGEGFDRATDGSIVRLRCPAIVPIDEVKKAIAETLAKMELAADQVAVVGLAEGKPYVVRFSGAGGVAAKKSGKFFGFQHALMGPDSPWAVFGPIN
jgi:hypothetical protein